MKTTLLLAATTLALTTGFATARHLPHAPQGQSIYCATREAGNPHSKYCDYLAWSFWRRRGGWDSTLDNACLRNPHYVPDECGGAAHY